MRRVVTYLIRGTSDPRVARAIALKLAGAAPKDGPNPKPEERKTR